MGPPKQELWPKESDRLVATRVRSSSRPDTPKILVIYPVFMGKNRFFADFAMKILFFWSSQRWSRGHKARGQGHKKNPRPRTRMLEAEAKDQGHKCKCFPKIKVLKNFFSVDLQKKTVWKNIFQPIYKILTIQKILLSSSRGQGNFRGPEASRPRPRTWKCVLEDVLEAKDVLEDSTSGSSPQYSHISR